MSGLKRPRPKCLWPKCPTFIFLPISLNMCFGCSEELSHWDGSFEHPQHMFWMRNKEKSFPIHTLIWRPAWSQKLAFLSTLCSAEVTRWAFSQENQISFACKQQRSRPSCAYTRSSYHLCYLVSEMCSIQTAWHSNSDPERIFFEKFYFEKNCHQKGWQIP